MDNQFDPGRRQAIKAGAVVAGTAMVFSSIPGVAKAAGNEFVGESVVEGMAKGRLLYTTEGISFWGGVDPATGVLNEKGHPLFEQDLSNVILAFPQAKGSAGALAVLVEMCRVKKFPLAFINVRTDATLAAAAVITKQFYGVDLPIVNVDQRTFDKLKDYDGQTIIVDGSKGLVQV